ncbi:ABC-F family ATP-binding cassette domain-containing protein [Muriicola sp.]|uniref:ABC-F family ATP-binding cassette domain-containing protein n=2 Tax=Muriicola sp. TaxID=2020856 RepID=UPI00356B1C90
MNLVSVEEISKGFGERILFSGLSFGINAGQKIALIAQNGTGKTSILNILAGKEQPDTGMVNTRKGLRISYLEQDPDLDGDLSLEETVFRSDNEILRVIRDYEKALDNPGDQKRYQKAFEAMERHNAWDFETQYKQILFKLQLTDLQARVGTLSGGQKKRLALAHALLNKPDLLILDEPTNHLDLEMIEWLEHYFARENITLFMVTHDRYFLERVCDEILELDGGNLYSYKGNYSYFLEKKEAREMREAVELHKSRQLYRKELDWMRRQPKARTTKSKSRIDDFQEIKSKAQQRRKDHEVQLEINMERLGSKILEFHNVVKSFPDTPILDKFSYSFVKGERLGIIGKNGTGKTTFLNLLTGNTLPDGGKIITGETVKFGYYTQEGISVKEGQKVIEVIRDIAEYIPLKKGRQLSAQQLLERFLFDRKKQYDFVEKLSGGEKKRLYLCTVLIQNPNFLILDEPTNDLDVVTLNVLESFLLDYPGCLVVVSHDRYFMDKIVDHLFVFRGEGIIEDFPGNYSDFRAYEDSLDASKKAEKASDAEKGQTTRSPWREEGKRSNLSYSEQKEYKQLEREIQKLEVQKKELQDAFLNPDITPEEIASLSKSLQETEQQIDQKTERWYEISLRAES